EFVADIGEKKLAESVHREDRRFQIVRQDAEESNQLFMRQRLLRLQRHEACATATGEPGRRERGLRLQVAERQDSTPSTPSTPTPYFRYAAIFPSPITLAL